MEDVSRPPLERLRALTQAFVRSECEEAEMRGALDDAAPLYRDAPEARALKASGAEAMQAFMREALPRAPDDTRRLAGDLVETVLGTVGQHFSETPRSPDQIEAYADAWPTCCAPTSNSSAIARGRQRRPASRRRAVAGAASHQVRAGVPGLPLARLRRRHRPKSAADMTIATTDPGSAEAAPLASALKERHVAMIALGGVIGAGLFVGSSAAILAAGPAALASYAIAGAIVFLVMRMLGEMAVARPGLGSFNAYIRAALGPRAAFVAAWLYWYFWIIAVGAETIAGAALLHDWIAAPVWLIGLVLIALLTATNLMSVKAYGEFEFWFSLLKVLAILAFIVVAAGHLGLLALNGASPATTLLGSGGAAPNGLAAVLGAVPTVIFSLTGSEIASIAAAESEDPPGNVARASRTVALRITVFYLLAILLVVATVPWPALQSGQSPFVAAMRAIGIPGAAVLMQAVILVAVLSCLNSSLYVCSRTVFELAAAGDAPRALAAVGANKVPARAILLGSVAGFLAAIASVLSPGVVFAFLLATSGSVILVVYVLVALAQIADRRRRDAAGETPAFPMWGFPWLSYAAIAGIVVIFVTMAFLPDQRGQLLAGAGSVGLVTVAAFSRLHAGKDGPRSRVG